MNWKKPKVYAVKHIDSEVRAASRSGGIFTAISDEVLNHGGIIYGCVLTEKFEAVHIRAVTADERNAMRGSKYIQSNLGDVFKQVIKDLNDGKQVLFSGTSCQVAGLRSFLGKHYDNLLCIDIVCHGVPSPAVWKKYLQWQESKNEGKIQNVDFRNKKDYGWAAHIESLFFDNEKKVDSRVFTTLFYEHSILRPACYKCPYKDIVHPGDITIADYWGIDKAAPGFNDNKGVSLVLVNNELGEQLFHDIKDELDIRETKIEDSMQPPLKAPFDIPDNREQFWVDFYTTDFETVAKKYGGYGFKNDVKNSLKKIKRKIKRLIKR